MAGKLLRPIYVVSKKEFKTNLLSIRMAIMLSILALVVVGGSYGFAGFSVAPEAGQQYVLFVHPAIQDDQLGVVAFVSDAWGVPQSGVEVELRFDDLQSGQIVLVDTKETDTEGFARFSGLAEGFYFMEMTAGTISRGTGITLDPLYPLNLTWGMEIFDLDDSGLMDNLAIHFLDIDGEVPSGVAVYLEDEGIGSPDSRGFMAVKLNEGENNLTFSYEGEDFFNIVFAEEGFQPFNPFAQGPDFVLFFIALSFGGLLLPFVAIALSFDSISKEKVQGSADLLLYRPATWRSIAIGKFLGIFVAVALPVAAVNLAAALIITVITGIMPSAMVILGFIAFSLFLVAAYILMMQAFSSVAKTAGTAIILAIVVWFVFNLMWSVVIYLITLVTRIPFGSREYFVLASYLGLFNPNSIYSNLFVLVAPEGFDFLGGLLGLSGGLFALPNWAPAVAAVAWLVVLLILFLEVYRRKAAG